MRFPRSQCIPYFDKTGLYSTIASALKKVISSKVRKTWFLEDYCELALGVGWLNAFVRHYELMNDWAISGDTIDGNLTLRFLQDMVSKFGSVSGGPGMRVQPFLNFSLKQSMITKGLRILRDVILGCNLGKMKQSEAVSRLTDVAYIVDLGAQHVISVLTLLRVIHNPSFVTEAVVCKGTTTFKKINKHFRLSEKAINALYNELAEMWDTGTARPESVGCEFLKESKDPTLRFDCNEYRENVESKRKKDGTFKNPDVFYGDQSLFAVEGKDTVVEHYFDQDLNVQKRVCPPLEIVSDERREWMVSDVTKSRDYEVKVATNSRLQDLVLEQPKKLRKPRKAIAGTGIGEHIGLMEELMLCNRRKWLLERRRYDPALAR